MNTIDLASTNLTPAVKFGKDGKLSIVGRSISTNEISFYDPLFTWAATLHIESLIVDINLEYVNSACSMKLLQLLKALESNIDVRKIMVNWYYDEGDDDALLRGQVLDESLPASEFRFHVNTDID
jgi:hypothetical protein